MFGKEKKQSQREISELAEAVNDLEDEHEYGGYSHSETLDLIRAVISLDDVINATDNPKIADPWKLGEKEAVRYFNVALGEFIREFQRMIDENNECSPYEDGKPLLYGMGCDD